MPGLSARIAARYAARYVRRGRSPESPVSLSHPGGTLGTSLPERPSHRPSGPGSTAPSTRPHPSRSSAGTRSPAAPTRCCWPPRDPGKTLAAFLWAIDRLVTDPVPPANERCRVLYVSPLKALAVDVERNLRAPLTGIRRARRAARHGAPRADRRPAHRRHARRRTAAAGARTRPTSSSRRPESLYLMLTSRRAETLRSVAG